METKAFNLLGLGGENVSIVAPLDIVFPSIRVVEFDTYCGAGDGIGDLVVPDRVFIFPPIGLFVNEHTPFLKKIFGEGIPISPACFVHDTMWVRAEPTWEAFHQSNSVFLHNLISLIETQSHNSYLRERRLYRAVTYYNAVDSLGQYIFWNLKDKQKKKS